MPERWRILARALIVGTAVAGAAMIGTAGVSLACVPQPLVTVQPRATGPSGTRATVEGIDFGDGSPVEIRWNGATGPMIGAATGPQFSVEVKIPDTAAGLYGLVVLARSQDGGISSAARSAFEVLAEENRTGMSSRPTSHRRRSSAGTAALFGAVGLAVFVVGGIAGFGTARRGENVAPGIP